MTCIPEFSVFLRSSTRESRGSNQMPSLPFPVYQPPCPSCPLLLYHLVNKRCWHMWPYLSLHCLSSGLSVRASAYSRLTVFSTMLPTTSNVSSLFMRLPIPFKASLAAWYSRPTGSGACPAATPWMPSVPPTFLHVSAWPLHCICQDSDRVLPPLKILLHLMPQFSFWARCASSVLHNQRGPLSQY